MNKSNTNILIIILLLIIIAANPWMLKTAFSNLLSLALWILGALTIFFCIAYIIDLIRYSKTPTGKRIKNSKLDMLAILVFLAFISLGGYSWATRNEDVAFIALAALLLSNLILKISENNGSLRQTLISFTRFRIRPAKEFSIFRTLKLLFICLIPFSLLVLCLMLGK